MERARLSVVKLNRSKTQELPRMILFSLSYLCSHQFHWETLLQQQYKTDCFPTPGKQENDSLAETIRIIENRSKRNMWEEYYSTLRTQFCGSTPLLFGASLGIFLVTKNLYRLQQTPDSPRKIMPKHTDIRVRFTLSLGDSRIVAYCNYKAKKLLSRKMTNKIAQILCIDNIYLPYAKSYEPAD